MTQEFHVTQQKVSALQAELHDIRKHILPQLAKRIDDAKQMGDLSENAEYKQAREELAWTKSREMEIQTILDNASIIEKTHSDIVQIGSELLVRVKGKEKTYHIVGAQEADPLQGNISNESPLGQALLGKKVGDQIDVEAPAGMITYEIIKII